MSRIKMLVAGAVLVAFLSGAVFANYVQPALTRTSQEPAARPVVQRRSAPVVRRTVYTESPAYLSARKRRTLGQEVLIVAGSAGAGALIGAAAGGRKGAAIGAASGGVAGLVYDLATRNRQR